MNRLTRCWSRCRPMSTTLRAGLLVEELENRALPSGTPLAPGFQPLAATGTNVTLDHAQDLQILIPGGSLAVAGTIGNGPAAAADVAFYRFTLAQATRVHLETLDVPHGRHLDATLSLYNTDPTLPDPNAPNQIIDTQDNLGFHLLAQNDGAGNQGFAAVDRTLGAGTYYVAVSGSGNDYFNPFLVGSGYQGGTGAYVMQLTASDAGVGPNDGPAVDARPDLSPARSPQRADRARQSRHASSRPGAARRPSAGEPARRRRGRRTWHPESDRAGTHLR